MFKLYIHNWYRSRTNSATRCYWAPLGATGLFADRWSRFRHWAPPDKKKHQPNLYIHMFPLALCFFFFFDIWFCLFLFFIDHRSAEFERIFFHLCALYTWGNLGEVETVVHKSVGFFYPCEYMVEYMCDAVIAALAFLYIICTPPPTNGRTFPPLGATEGHWAPPSIKLTLTVGPWFRFLKIFVFVYFCWGKF